MEEHKPGKRLASGGSKGAGRTLALLLAAAAVVLALAYVGLCAWVGASSTILPRVSAAGVGLGGLTQAQATERLNTGVAERYADASVNLTYSGQTAVFTGALVEADAEGAAQSAWNYGRTGGFLTRGGYLLSTLITGHEVEAPLRYSETGRAQVDQMLEDISQAVGGDLEETTWEIQGDHLVFHMGSPGTGVDQAALRQTVLVRLAALDSSPYEVEPITTEPSFPDLEAIHRALYAEVADASLDPTTFEITPSVTGMTFDIAQARQLLEGAAWGSDCAVPLEITEPKISTENLRELLFRDVLGEATSKVTGSANRKSNVALAASTFNERILLPGDVFSYNDTTGSRTAEKGYLMAPVYKGGKSVDEVGGGICQPSSTLYLAALNSNLKIVERHQHQFAVGYVPDGLDATVYYGSLDFRFENDTDYPVKLVAKSYKSSGSTYLTVTIYGTKTDDLHVKMTNKVYNWVEYETVYQVDAAVPAGTVKEGQNGYKGRNADTYRNLYDAEGNLVSSTLESTNKYKVRERILLVNPADAAQYGLNADGTPLAPGAASSTPAINPAPTGSQPPASESPAVSESPALSPDPSASPSPEAPSSEPSQEPETSPAPDIGIPIYTPSASEENAEGGSEA